MQRKLLRDGSLVFEIKVLPRAHTRQVSERMADGTLKVKVTAAPDRGRANEEVCAVIAEYLGVPRRCVEVVVGHTSQKKRVRITL